MGAIPGAKLKLHRATRGIGLPLMSCLIKLSQASWICVMSSLVPLT